MKWVLIYTIVTAGYQPISSYEGNFDTVDQCFKEREIFMDDKGYPHVGTQAVCIKVKE